MEVSVRVNGVWQKTILKQYVLKVQPNATTGCVKETAGFFTKVQMNVLMKMDFTSTERREVFCWEKNCDNCGESRDFLRKRLQKNLGYLDRRFLNGRQILLNRIWII